MLKRFVVCVAICLSMLACKKSRVENLKNFHIFVESNEPALKNSISRLTEAYNQKLGYEALTIVDRLEDSNSVIHFQQGLVQDGRKLGLGQWIAMKNVKTQGLLTKTDTTTIEYGMDIIFDRENFLKKSAMIDSKDSEAYKHLFHLFCHEVGHGMQMDHALDINNVMYPSIPEVQNHPVNFTAYFAQIRTFLGKPDFESKTGPMASVAESTALHHDHAE